MSLAFAVGEAEEHWLESRPQYETNLDGIADAYAAMDERRAIKSLVRVGTV